MLELFMGSDICPVCGKEFVLQDREMYGWKFGDDCFCSYTCMRKVETKYIEYRNKLFKESLKSSKMALPKDLANVYEDIMRIKHINKQLMKIKRFSARKKYAEYKDILNKKKIEYRKALRVIKGRYARAVSRLSKKDYEMLKDFLETNQSVGNFFKKYKMSYEEICNTMIKILRFLDENREKYTLRSRWYLAG